MGIITETLPLVVILLFVGVKAQSSEVRGPCTYTNCDGSCVRQYGVEVCVGCSDGQTGYLCDIDDISCAGSDRCGNSSCQDEPLSGGSFCVCQPGYSGSRCENQDDSKICGGVLQDESDMWLLPTCSLKSTLTQLSQCINYQLPYYEPTITGSDNRTWSCNAKVTQTVQCFYRTIRDCSLNLCPSIYNYGGDRLYQNIAAEFYDPTSNFSTEMYGFLCSGPGPNGTYEYPTEMYNIGAPVCGSNLFDNLLRILTDFVNNYPADPTQLCPSLVALRTSIYNEVSSSCDWTNVGAALNLTDIPDMPGYIAKLFDTAQELFQEWVVPGCEVQTCFAPCQNNGTCYEDRYGVQRCECTSDYHGDYCEYSAGACAYTECQHGSSCLRDRSSGLEYCLCSTETTGLFCELSTESCDTLQCQNGSCYNQTRFSTCVCDRGYSGSRCEFSDETKQCPTIPADGSDMIFLPTCTLKNTLTKLSNCINYFLPFVDPGDRQAIPKCYTKIQRAKQCMYRVIEECSNTKCESAYWYGFGQLYLNISLSLYDFTSNFSRAVFEEICVLPEDVPEMYTPTYLIGEPVCNANVLDRLLSILAESGRTFPIGSPPEVFCRHLENLKYALYNETKTSCDFSNIKDGLPYIFDPDSRPMYWERLLNMAQEFFLEWTIPACQAPTDPCDGYCMNNGYCSVNFDGSLSCACPENWGGARCEKFDSTNVCPVAGDGDALLLPLCTLRSTLNGTLHCFADLALAAGGRSDFFTCSAQILPSITCFAHLVGNCSRSTCPSIWLIEGAPAVGQEIFATLFDPQVIGAIAQYACTAPPPGGYAQLLLPLIGNFSIPFCQSSFLSELVGVLAYVETEVLGITEISQLCSVVEDVRGRVGGLLDQCDFSLLGNYLPMEISAWLQTVVSAGRDIIRTYTLPGCENVADGPCPVATAGSSQCQLADVWMCNYYEYRRSFSEWGTQFGAWLQSCSNFEHRNWDEWAISIGLKPSYQPGGAYGIDGFIRMYKANAPCPSIPERECMGRKFVGVTGCIVCYNPGASRSARDLLNLYAEEFRYYHVITKIYSALRESCSRSTLSCDGVGSTTAPPMPTFSSGFSTQTFVPPSGQPYTSPGVFGTSPSPATGNGQN